MVIHAWQFIKKLWMTMQTQQQLIEMYKAKANPAPTEEEKKEDNKDE